MYNTTAMETSGTIVTFFDAIFLLKDANGDPIYFAGYSILVILFFALFMTMKRNSDFVIGLIASSFIVSIVAVLMVYQHYVPVLGALIPILLLIASLLYLIFTKEGTF